MRRPKHHMVYAKVKVLTKEAAQKFLDCVDEAYQRSRNESTIEKYQRDMDAGDWIPGAAIVAVDAKNRTINGQHVLAAFIRSKLKALTVILTINRHPDAIYGYDHNRKRAPKDDLKWDAVPKPGEQAAVAVVLFQYEEGHFKGTSYSAARSSKSFPSAAQIRRIVQMHPAIDAHCFRNPFRGKGISIAALRAASYILHQQDHENAKAFFESFLAGTNIPSKNHPIAVLRYEIEGLTANERVRNGTTLGWCFKAWNAYISGQTLARPLLRRKEPFPELIPEPDEPKDRGSARVQ